MSVPKRPKLSDHIQQRTREWFRKAEHELAYLEHSPFDEEDPPTDTACKMAHIVAEYSLKAFLMLNKRKILKIHDLDSLLDQCIEIDNHLSNIKDECQELSAYKTTLTYPLDPPIVIDIAEANNAIENAKRIKQFIQQRAIAYGYNP